MIFIPPRRVKPQQACLPGPKKVKNFKNSWIFPCLLKDVSFGILLFLGFLPLTSRFSNCPTEGLFYVILFFSYIYLNSVFSCYNIFYGLPCLKMGSGGGSGRRLQMSFHILLGCIMQFLQM